MTTPTDITTGQTCTPICKNQRSCACEQLGRATKRAKAGAALHVACMVRAHVTTHTAGVASLHSRVSKKTQTQLRPGRDPPGSGGIAPSSVYFYNIVVLFDELIRPHHLATALVTQPTQGGGNAAQDPLPQHPE